MGRWWWLWTIIIPTSNIYFMVSHNFLGNFNYFVGLISNRLMKYGNLMVKLQFFLKVSLTASSM